MPVNIVPITTDGELEYVIDQRLVYPLTSRLQATFSPGYESFKFTPNHQESNLGGYVFGSEIDPAAVASFLKSWGFKKVKLYASAK